MGRPAPADDRGLPHSRVAVHTAGDLRDSDELTGRTHGLSCSSIATVRADSCALSFVSSVTSCELSGCQDGSSLRPPDGAVRASQRHFLVRRSLGLGAAALQGSAPVVRLRKARCERDVCNVATLNQKPTGSVCVDGKSRVWVRERESARAREEGGGSSSVVRMQRTLGRRGSVGRN